MHKSSLSLGDYGVFPLESDVLGNGPASFGKTLYCQVPRRPGERKSEGEMKQHELKEHQERIDG